MNTMFTVEESNLICIFAGEGRNEVIEDIERSLPYLKDEDMAELSGRVIGRLFFYANVPPCGASALISDEFPKT